jgi:hypothetical protein
MEPRSLVAMRWYARPEGDNHQLRIAPRLASWNKADDPDQVQLRAFLDATDVPRPTAHAGGYQPSSLQVPELSCLYSLRHAVGALTR